MWRLGFEEMDGMSLCGCGVYGSCGGWMVFWRAGMYNTLHERSFAFLV